MSHKILLFFVLLLMCFVTACQNSSGEQPGIRKSQEMKSNVPQLKKIAIQNKAQADSLIQSGIDVIVVEDTYVVARLAQQDAAKIEAMNLKSEPIKEEDLKQRLVKIAIHEKADVSELVNLGIDIWEVKEDTVIAQVFDKYIREAESKGYVVEIVAKNVLDTVKKKK